MKIKLPNNYWDNKCLAYIHDHLDKVFNIKNNKTLKQIAESLGLNLPNDEFWASADFIASGFEQSQNILTEKEIINFFTGPILTHPTGKQCYLKPKFKNINCEKIISDLVEFIKKDIGQKKGIDRFLYLHLVLRFKLANENIGGLGALWHRLPAEPNFPSYSIWQHSALVSAINSCFELSNKDDLGMMVFSITPVQSFISNARKLRDFWTGSVFLSYLAFEGIKWVIENLGPDHILYPSLLDQFLVNEYLRKKWGLNENINSLNIESTIASFPNKFLVLVPFSNSEDYAQNIEKSIKNAWKDINLKVLDFILNKFNCSQEIKVNKDYLNEIFERQNDNFWDIKWAAVKMLSYNNKNDIEELLSEKNYKSNFELFDILSKNITNEGIRQKLGIGLFYSISHTLCQLVLAKDKLKKKVIRKQEPGEKCDICCEFECLHGEKYQNNFSAKEYNESIKKFWNYLKNEIDKEDGLDLNENEKLCSICATKRFAYKVLQNDKEHLLEKTFSNSKSFPSTTYMALYNFFKRNNIINEEEKRELAQKLFEDDDFESVILKNGYSFYNEDKYYAILLMDGDKMGQLINGETIAATWDSIIHPTLLDKIKSNNDNLNVFKEILNKKLNITPAIHASISESLGDFALYGVSSIIKKYDGRLIYAGGDDVCAIMPIETAIDAAKEISDYYRSYFKIISSNNDSIYSNDLHNEFEVKNGKLSINLGNGDNISISAGILICHHKANLKHMIIEAHNLLEIAKEKGGRNALAVQLKKRSGNDRYFITKWNNEKLNSFKYLVENIGNKISHSLSYNLARYEIGINEILNTENNSDLLQKFILAQIKNLDRNVEEDIAKHISKVIITNDTLVKNSSSCDEGKEKFSNDPLIIAGFLHKRLKEENI